AYALVWDILVFFGFVFSLPYHITFLLSCIYHIGLYFAFFFFFFFFFLILVCTEWLRVVYQALETGRGTWSFRFCKYIPRVLLFSFFPFFPLFGRGVGLLFRRMFEGLVGYFLTPDLPFIGAGLFWLSSNLSPVSLVPMLYFSQ